MGDKTKISILISGLCYDFPSFFDCCDFLRYCSMVVCHYFQTVRVLYHDLKNVTLNDLTFKLGAGLFNSSTLKFELKSTAAKPRTLTSSSM
jgi:hypothetical protein